MFAKDAEQLLVAVNAATATNETLPVSVLPERRTSVIPLLIEMGRQRPIIRDYITGRPIESAFSSKTSDEQRETEVNLRMLYHLAESPTGPVGVWLSPPDPRRTDPDMGKVLIATTREKEGSLEIVQYDITGGMFSRQDFLEFTMLLENFSREGYFFLENSPWNILSQVIPMGKVWEGIADGSLEDKFSQQVERMRLLAKGKSPRQLAREIYDSTGARVGGACPPMRKETSIKRIGVVFAEHCGLCGKDINEWISPGDKCKYCNEVYLGVCS